MAQDQQHTAAWPGLEPIRLRVRRWRMEIRERIRKETDRENVSERTLSAAQRGDGREGEHEADRRAGGWGGV